MIKLLTIKNIALAASVELELGPGLNLLTGETGAGKSILVDALGLLLGARASADLIRTGEEHAVVEGAFESRPAAEALAALGLPADGDEVIIRREVQASGRGRATVNGALVPVGTLRELGPRLAAIHGQHEPQGLLDPETHLTLLDHHAGLTAEAEAVGEPFRRLRAIEAELAALQRDRREAERRREMLEFQAGEIDKAALAPGEEEELRREKVVQLNAGRLAALSTEAYGILHEEEAAVLTRLGQVYRRMEELAAIDSRFSGLLEGRAEAKAHLEEMALFLRDYQEGLQVSPGRLDEIEARLAAIERLKRKYGATVEEVVAFGARCRAELQALGSPEERERVLEADRARVAEEYLKAARELSRRRRVAAREMEKKIEGELGQLAMEKTRFRVAFAPEALDGQDPAGWTERGLEAAEFLLSPNPGEELRPLARVASGGELSRILLALNSVAGVGRARGAGAGALTVVFDEVDAGIGGRVAEVVGRKLRALADRHQVLCVTHLPQIASLADQHFVVRKRLERGRTWTEVAPLDGTDRVEEVARMLGGETITEAARKHAREMVRQSVRT
jgi:DNA repair protein RecN (Recombination protein N)